jgi:hypothetical protein
MIEQIERTVIWRGRTAGPTWFHPRACLVPGRAGPTLLMTCQTISGSDFFGPVHCAASADLGASWTAPEPVPSLGRHTLASGMDEGVCDVVPDYHAPTDTVLAMGHNVYYKDGRLTQPNDARFVVYAVCDAAGRWSERRDLVWDDPRATAIYSCGCAQRLALDDGRLIVPLTFGPTGRDDRGVGTVLCSYDGEQVRVLETGNELRLPVGRGLLEPSLVRFRGKVFMTIRAEDDHGYVSSSDDGLDWPEQRPWCWEDGEALVMSTTQQRWLAHSDGLHLVYTRKAEGNVNVFRWRAPLYVAQVDVDRLCLVRETEQVVLPLIGDGIDAPAHVARMGNFHPANVSPRESLVTVGETLPEDNWQGDTLCARILWSAPNRLLE